MNIDRIAPGDRVLCAVSGGADSMYLLGRMLEAAPTRGFTVACAHFNHRLRGAESDRDETFVRDYCAAHGVPCFVGSGDVAAIRGVGTEAAARELRYAFLQRTAAAQDCRWIATAHTADDNAETMLLQLARGAGLRGLGGISPARENLMRPMLDVTRSEVLRWLAENGVPHVEDSSNASDAYARNRVRHEAVPALKAVNAAFSRHTVQTAALLREDEAFLQDLASDFLREHAPEDGIPTAALAALARPVRARAFQRLLGDALTQTHIEALHDFCVGTERASLDLPGRTIRREQGRVYVSAPRPTPWPERELRPGYPVVNSAAGEAITISLPTQWGEIHNTFTTFHFKNNSIHGTLIVTPRKAGDSIRIAGRGCTKKLSDLFAERGLTAAERDSVAVLRDAEGVAAVFGFGMAERLIAAPGDTVIRVELRKQ